MNPDTIARAYDEASRKFLTGYQTSELSFEVKGILEDLKKRLLPLLTSKSDISALFASLSSIIQGLPCDVEQTPLGREYTFATGELFGQASAAKTIRDFLAATAGKPTGTDPAKGYFERHLDDNPYSGPAEYYRYERPLKNSNALKAFLSKLGMTPLCSDSCFHSSIHGIPVFVSIAQESKGRCRVEIRITNQENPFEIDDGATRGKVVLDEHFRSLNL